MLNRFDFFLDRHVSFITSLVIIHGKVSSTHVVEGFIKYFDDNFVYLSEVFGADVSKAIRISTIVDVQVIDVQLEQEIEEFKESIKNDKYDRMLEDLDMYDLKKIN